MGKTVIKLSGEEINCRLEDCSWDRLQEIRASELSTYDSMLLEYEITAREDQNEES